MLQKFFVLLSLLALLIGVVGFAALTTGPYVGFLYEHRDGAWRISAVEAGSPAAAFSAYVGAELVAVNGFRLERYDLESDMDVIPDRAALLHAYDAQRHLAESVRPGSAVRFTIQTTAGGETRSESSFEVQAVSLPPAVAASRTFLLYFLGLGCMAIGLSVIVRRVNDARARVFFFMLHSVSCVFFTFGTWAARDLGMTWIVFFALWLINNLYGFLFFPAFFFHFCLLFPKEKRIVARLGGIFPFALYAVPILVAAIYIPRVSFQIYHLYWAAGLLGGAAAMLHGYVTQKSALLRAQLKWILWGSAVFGLGMFVTYSLPILLNSFSLQGSLALYSYVLPSLFFMFVPVSFAMAIVRYRIMDIDILFDNTFVYAIVIGAFFLLDLCLLAVFSLIDPAAPAAFRPVQTILSLWLLLALYAPLRDRATRFVKRVLRRELYEINDVSIEFSRGLVTARDEQDAVAAFVAKIRDIMAPREIWGSFSAKLASDRLAAVLTVRACSDFPVPMCEAAAGLSQPRHIISLFPALGDDSLLADFAPSVAVPLAGFKENFGMLVIGEKRSGKLYNRNDLRLLALLASQLSLTLESLINRREVEKKEIESLRERQRLSREIHDGIGGSFSSALMLVDIAEREPPEASRGRLNDLKDILASGFAELRNLIWTIEENEDTLGQLAAFIQDKVRREAERHGLRVRFQAALDWEGGRLPAAVRLNIIRIVQELLANAVRHARARELKLSFSCDGARLAVSFADDGRGFEPGSAPAGGYGIRNMRRRAEELGGSIELRSAPGSGTEARLELPMYDRVVTV